MANKEEVMEKMMKGKEGKKVDKKESKMKSLKALHKMASDMMSDDMKNMKRVTVAAKDDEGLKEGLEKAKEIIGMKKDKDED